MRKNGRAMVLLEELYPAFGNLVPRDIASREILRIVEMGFGVDEKRKCILMCQGLSPEKQHK